jgi:hypothetical protein
VRPSSHYAAPAHARGISKLFVAQLDDQELAMLERALGKVIIDCSFGCELGLASATDCEDLVNQLVGPGRLGSRRRVRHRPFTRVMAEAVTSALTAMGVNPSREAIARARRLTRVANCGLLGGNRPSARRARRFVRRRGEQRWWSITYRILCAPWRCARWCTCSPRGPGANCRLPAATSRIGRHLIGPFTSPAMQNNPVHLLDRMVR